jgi:hypothetical protein
MTGFFMTNEFGSLINLTLEFGEYKISITADNSCNGSNNQMMRFYIAVFRDNDYITDIIFKEDNLLSDNEAYGTEENLLTAIEFCKSNMIDK